jgi:hypothetical protein
MMRDFESTVLRQDHDLFDGFTGYGHVRLLRKPSGNQDEALSLPLIA